ncbi:Scopoletin glucosyltransferase [Bienertia sinuspersici]
MGGEPQQLHVVLFPFMAHGHMIPTLDIARLFAARGVKTTIITTHANAPTFTTIIEKHNNNKSEAPIINLELFEFHAQEAGLPQGCENLEQALGPGIMDRFIKATELLREQLEQLLEKVKPNCLVADMFFPWATESAAKFSIPRLVFHGTSFFSLCVAEVIRVYEPFKSVSSDEEMVVLPSLPHEVGLTRLQLSEDLRKEEETESKRRASMIKESELTSYGVIVNSFYELEPEYADFFRKDLGRKAWHIGPVSLNNRTIDEKAQRGKQASINEHECLKWLNSKKPYSVIYICFGSTAHLIPQQLHEIAAALEACGQDFIWVVRNEDCLPSGMADKGLIIRGWAPQVLILEHEAVGAFLTHCGWNSTLEGIAAGVQMITWPVFAEQFYNEKLVTKILKIGIPVGAKKWTVAPSAEDVIPRNEIEKAFREIMEGVEAEERRQRAKEYKELAWKAIEEGGSSYTDLTALINELKVFFPFMGHGHMIPVLDIAKLFVAHNNVKATIITTPLNAHTFTNNENNNKINVELFSFPAKEAGLPEGCESLDLSLGPASIYKFLKATTLLQEQLEQYLEKVRPNCLVADMFFPWATKSATKFSIPRLVFHGMSSFSLCAQEVIRLHEPFKKVSSDEELFVLPDFPHEVTLTRLQVPQDLLSEVETEHKRRMVEVKKSEVESYGVIVNSFYELEPDYAEFYRKDLGRRAWNIGPVSLSNRSNKEKTNRGKQASINEHDTTRFITPQLHEIASAIEASSKEFIWVVRGSVVDNEKSEEWLPLGFEQRVKGKGLLIRGWAPQMLILGHEAVGAFVTHCGWNSTLEGISAGVPMVTWPVFAEQFYNEKLVTEIVKTGISVGVKKWSMMPTVEDIMKSETIEKALREIMEGKEAEERRSRAKKLKEMAQKAVEEGGSSHSDLNALINELKSSKNNMGTEPQELHVVFFPFMAHGHMIPTLDIARLFAAHNHVKATIITTPLNATTFSKFIGVRTINIEVFRFPAQEAGLPEGIENLEQVKEPVLAPKFFKATQMLQEQLELYLEDVQPNCLVADMFFPWATESAAKFSIPRIVFHGISSFSLCAQEIVRLHEPFKNVTSDEELFVVPLLPDEIQFTRLQIPEELQTDEENEYKKRMRRLRESEIESYGVIFNSFYELEPQYADFYREQLGSRAWSIGPVSLSNGIQKKSQTGKRGSINEDKCLQWLDSKKPNSVIYISFGSTASFIAPQLHEIATALDASEQDFIWVVKNDDNGKSEEWLPTGFEQRTEGKGLILRGWAPQVLVLEHEAIGAFVTHCGWNSTLEAISAGVPMVTWPIFAEQFYNEKLVTHILKTGIPVGAKKWNRTPSIEEMVKKEAIEKALREIMVGDEAKERRSRAKKLKEMAQKAVEEGGSSYSALSALINELRDCTSDTKISKNMDAEPQELHVVFFPFMGHGHMIPTLDVASLFAARKGVKATIITTPLNVAAFNGGGTKLGAPIINIKVFRFPAQEAGLPEGLEKLEQVMTVGLFPKFLKAANLLQEQLEQYLEETRPDCLVADMFFPWATESAAKFNIPRLVFHGICSFSLCAQEIVRVHEPFKNVSSDKESFVLPLLPNEIQLTRQQISEDLQADGETDYKKRMDSIKGSELESYGVIVNSFYELEPEYADFFRKELGRRAWNIGPVSLRNRSREDKGQRGKQTSIDGHECMKWLNSKKPNSVVYICFGSTISFIDQQLHEIAMALEASGQEFIWVVKNGKGRVVANRGWAPQVLILEHEAIGAFVTHCGWNSTLEAISAEGLERKMVGKEVEERRGRAKKLKEMAQKALEDGGSSYSELTALINELRVYTSNSKISKQYGR